MTAPSDRAPNDISQLLQRGLDYFGRNRAEDAIRCWKEVLKQQPGHPEAIDYLDAAGVDVKSLQAQLQVGYAHSASGGSSRSAEVINMDAVKRSAFPTERRSEPVPTRASALVEVVECRDSDGVDCEEIGRLMSERRYEEVLSLLYAARKRAPKDAALSRSIRHVRERLASEYAYRLEDLDRVPRPAAGREWVKLADADWSEHDTVSSRDARQLAALIDGISSYADIVAASPLGQLATLRGLCALLERGYLDVSEGDLLHGGHPAPARKPAPAQKPAPARKPAPAQKPVTKVRASQRHKPEPAPEPAPAAPLRIATANPEADAYSDLFKRATAAYLLRDYDRARELFGECCRKRPDDSRARHNLEALTRRMSKP